MPSDRRSTSKDGRHELHPASRSVTDSLRMVARLAAEDPLAEAYEAHRIDGLIEATEESDEIPEPSQWLTAVEQLQWLYRAGFPSAVGRAIISRDAARQTHNINASYKIFRLDWENSRALLKSPTGPGPVIGLDRRAEDFYRYLFPQDSQNNEFDSSMFQRHWADAFCRNPPRPPISAPRDIKPDVATEQGPATSQFESGDNRVDAMLERSAPTDREFGFETYRELIRKARALRDRLAAGNFATYVRDSIDGLLEALGENLDDVRPAVLLSRSRSIEAARKAFDLEEARRELTPDVIAMMDDTRQTLQDLMALLPIVREPAKSRKRKKL